MLYDVLIGTFREGDYAIGVFFWIVFLASGFFLTMGTQELMENYQWRKAKSFTHECHLLSIKVSPSTLETHTVPVATGKGVGVGVVTTGEDEKHITVWDCGKYGRLVSDDSEVFRWAKETSVLYLKQKGDEVRIDGIEGD